MQRPSSVELELLKCLWQLKLCSARELHACAGPKLGWSYSSTRKTLERMRDKALVAELDRHGLHVYKARVGKVAMLAVLADDFARRVLEIDGPLPVQAFADSHLLSEAELEQLSALLKDSPATNEAAE